MLNRKVKRLYRSCQSSQILRSAGVGILLMGVSLQASAAQQILWYPFNDLPGASQVSDASGNGNNAQVKGQLTLTGDAASFDGVDDYIELPDDLLKGLGSISVTAEVFIEDAQASPYFIYGLGNTSGNNGDGYLFTTGNYYRTSISSCNWSCEQTTGTSSANLPRGAWQHIAYTLADNVAVLYLNGKEVARNDNVTLKPADIGDGATAANFIGRSLYRNDNYFHGKIADFQIWDGALTAAEIAATVPQQILWYPFNDNTDATVIADASGHNNHGTAQGSVVLNGDIAQLDGRSGFIALPVNILNGLTDMSVTTKLRINSEQPDSYMIYGFGQANGKYFYSTGDEYKTVLSNCGANCEQSVGAAKTKLQRDAWIHLAFTLKGQTAVLYLDGVEVARQSNFALTPEALLDGSTLLNYLGRSIVDDTQFLQASFDDFQIWNGALSASAIASAAQQSLAEVQLTDAEAVTADAEALTIVHVDDIRGHIFLATEGQHGSSIQWASEDSDIITTDGLVTRAPVCSGLASLVKHCGEQQSVMLTATLTKGGHSTTKRFNATVQPLRKMDDFAGYLFSYFTGEGTADGEQVYFALSDDNDPLDWHSLNDDKPVLRTTLGEQGARDPFIIRSPDGDRFFMIATDLKIYGNGDWGRAQTWGSRALLVWESDDLINWSDARLVQVSPDTAGNTWAPEAFWDEQRNAYIVFWASKIYKDATHSNGTYNKMMYALTRDFVNFSEAEVWVDKGYSTIDSTIIKQDDTYYRFTKDERSASESKCGKFILLETSTTLNNTNWNFTTECIGKGGISRGEGPLVFKSNEEDRWYLFIDEFGGRGYIPFETTDLSSGKWTEPENYSLPGRPRHGTVLPITASEYKAIRARWGD